MALVPISGTDIRLLNEIPFSNDYKHTRWFDSVEDQTAYFFSKTPVHMMNDYTFQRVEGKTILACHVSIDALRGVNYVMFRNTEYNNKWFYCFVTKLEYKQRNNTHVHFELDVLQTWMFQMRFKPSYVMREHTRLWNEDGTPIIRTVDEGLDYGTEYETVSIENWIPYDRVFFLVIVCKQRMDFVSNEIEPSLNGSPQPLSYYVHPFKLDGSVPYVKSYNDVMLNLSKPDKVLLELYKMEVAQNNIVSIYVTEHIGQDFDWDADQDKLTLRNNNLTAVNIQDADTVVNTLYVENLPSYQKTFKSFGSKYAGYRSVKESKLLMYPYTRLVLDDFKGNRIEYKNEHITSNTLAITCRGSIGTSNKVVYTVEQYNNGSSISGTMLERLSLEHSLINNNPNDVPILTDLLAAYLQGNRNSLQNQVESIGLNTTANAISGTISAVGSAVTRNAQGVAESGVGVIQGLGNGVLTLQGMEAKQKDIDNVPPNIAKMGSNTNFDMGHRYNGVFIIKKQIKPEYIQKLEDFFHMFGYKIGRVKMPNFHTRQHFNYVQTVNCIIQGNFNNEDLNELKKIFDSGITLWHTNDVGNYELENGVL